MGLIDVYRINPADQFSVFSPSLKKTQEITYYTLLAKIRGDLNITGTSGNVDNWNEAYDQTIMSGVVTGYTTKTITLTRRDGTEISFDFQDLSPASEDTLDMVTTRGNSTVNIINVGGVSTPWLDLDTSYTGTTEVGRFSWNLDNATADLGLNDNVVLKVGQDDMWYVRNESGSAIPRGTAVMAVGTVGASGRILVSPMVANGSVAAKYLLGITSEEIADDADGYVLAKGNLREFNTSAYTAGQVLWCSPTTPGALTATEPAAPNLKLPIAFVVHADAEGMLAVRVTAGSTLSENNQVQFGTLANNDVLTYVSANGRWQNVPISTIASTLAFSTIAVTGQPSIVAETNQDTLNIASGTGISLTTNASTDTLTITNTAPDQIVSLTGTGTTTITGTYPNFTINSDDQYDGTVTSVALTAPSAFTVTGSPITTSGTLALGAAGTASQYIRGDGQLADFPTSGGGGSSVSYYLNGSINQGTFGGNTYYEFNKTPVIGAGTDFSISADGYIAQFITDANDPSLLEIPGGNWNVEFWFSASSSGGTPSFYVELSKYDGTTFTPIASSSGTPEFIAFGTTISQYYTALAVPQTTLAVTDRLAIRVYVIHSGRTITLHTENSHLCQVITTFSTGLNALNGLTKQVQYFATGTSGTDFNISSSVDTHTFNIPTASSLNRGALSSADWITFNSKADFSFKTIAVAGQSSIVADAADDTLTVVSGTGITLTTNSSTDTLTITNNAPDQTVVLTSGTGITTSGTYPSFTITNNDRGSSQNIFKNLAVSGQSTIVADNNDDTLTVASGTGISLTTNAVSDTLTITNTAPDQVVSITAGTGMSVTGTYPSFTVTNTAPDQVVSITGAGTSVVTGTYPNFTITSNDQYVGTVTSVNLTAGTGITVSGGPIISSGSITVNNSDRGSSQNIFKNIAVPGQTTIVASTNNDTFTIKPGSGMSATTLGNDITLSNTDPGSSQNIFKNIAVAGQNTIVADSNNDTLSFVAGTGISLTTNDTTDSLTVTNSAPDQVVALSSGTGISVSGTYPNFTITNTSPSSGGTVTGTGTTNYVTKWTTSSNIGDSQIFDNGTNVGIGTATPATKLHVNGGSDYNTTFSSDSFRSGWVITSPGTSTVRGSALVLSSDNSFRFGTASYYHISMNVDGSTQIFNTSGSVATTFASGGNVGIGTTSPVAKLTTITNAAGWAGWIENQDTTGNGSGLVITGASNVGGISLLVRKQDGTSTMTVRGDGNVGIGTTSPTQKLDVNGYITSQRYYPYSSGSTYIAGDTAGITIEGSGYFYVFPSAGSYFQGIARFRGGISNDTASYLQINGGSSNVTYFNGTVGIGTTAPETLLHISGTGNTFTRYTNTTNAGHFMDVGSNSSGQHFIFGYGAYPMLFGTNGSEVIRITSAGNVGIGTTTPNGKLQVDGDFYVNGLDRKIMNYNGAVDYGTLTNNSVRFNQNGAERARISTLGNFGIGTTAPNEKLHVAGRIMASGSGFTLNPTAPIFGQYAATRGYVQVPTNGQFEIWNGGTAEIATFYENRNSVFYGNVGIGTTSPSSLLEIAGASPVLTINRTSGTSSTINFNSSGSNFASIISNPSNGENRFSIGPAAAWGGFHTFYTDTSERMRITAAGNVGIGTTTPNLNATGTVLHINTSGNNASAIHFTNATTGTTATDGLIIGRFGDSINYLYTYENEPLHFGTNNAVRMVISTAGNVGIGNTSPGSTLDVTGNARATSLSTVSGLGLSVAGYAYLSQTLSGVMTFLGHNVRASDTVANTAIVQNGSWISSLIKMYYNEGITFHTDTTVYAAGATYPLATTERMRIQTNGNVGIGTSSPFSRLTVSGALSASTSQMSIVNTEGGHAIIRSGISGVSNNGISFVTANADGSSQNVRMVVSATGSVGIGTTSPSAPLTVVSQVNDGSSILTIRSSDNFGYSFARSNTTGFLEFDGNQTGNIGYVFKNGNVGIGTNNPTAALSVVRGAGAVAYIELAGNNNTIGTTSMVYGQDGGNNGYVWNRANAPIYFGTTGSTRMFLSAAGNFGIGTTSPSASLHVGSTGGVIFGATAGAVGTSQITTQNPVSPVSSRFAFGTDGTGWQYRIAKNTAGTIVDLVTVADSGNVGIGTTSPGHLLDVAGTGRFIQTTATPLTVYRTSVSSNVGIRFQNDTTSWYAGLASDDAFGISFNNANLSAGQVKITTSGNVGIGTTSPGSKLTVIGDIATSTRVASDTINGYTGGSTPLTIQTGGAQNLIIGTNNTERIRVTAAGDVGIGTTSPSAKLHVIGNATVSATLSTANAKITGTIADSFGLVGTAGQILSSTGTGIEWITGGGGGGGSTIIVKDEGTTIGSSFTTLDFVGNNIQASASGSTAVVTAYNNAGTGSIYANDTATQYAPPASFSNVEINSLTVEASAPDTAGTSQKLIAIVTFGVDNVSTFDGFNNFDFRLYNFSGSTAVPDTTHSWCSYMSKGEFEKRTVFTFHIPLYDGVGGSDVIRVQVKQSTAYTPEIYYCALTLIEGTN